ncbi:MAG: glycosyltransferase [Acidobacteria bacterium]|nr:MAG: glycosyltransferase [Acidobacteriota bacterium]
MRLLYIALDCPVPANNGLRLRTSMTLRALRAHGCRVSLLCLQSPAGLQDPVELQDLCDAYWLLENQISSLSHGGGWGGRLRAALSSLPYAAWRFRSSSSRRLLQQLCTSPGWDAILCDTVYSAVDLPITVAPLIINHHNLEHRIFDTYCQTETGRWKRALAAWEAAKVRRWEIKVGQRTALNWVCSRVDQDGLRQQQPGARIQVVPNVAPEEPASVDAEDDLVVFQGALDWFPNRDAVQFFLAEVWPRILQARPTARFLIVGRNPPAAFLARHRRAPHVSFTGTVPETAPYLARAAVAVAPLRIGSGTRLKILEAAALGKPTVATPLGAEGLAFTPGTEILLALEPAAFAAAVLHLLGSSDLRCRMGAAAQARIYAEYDFAALCRSIQAGLRALTKNREAPATASAGPVRCEG